MAKVQSDDQDAQKGLGKTCALEAFTHFVKVDVGVQMLQQEQLYAIASATLEHCHTEPRLQVFALWAGLIEQESFTEFKSVLVVDMIKQTIRPPTVTPFTGYKLPYVMLQDVGRCLEQYFRSNPIWNFSFIKRDRDYKHLTPPWSDVSVSSWFARGSCRASHRETACDGWLRAGLPPSTCERVGREKHHCRCHY